MKRFSKFVLFAAVLACLSQYAWSQASTEGKEFWVALNMTAGTAGGNHEPFICITTQHKGGSYTITNPADPDFKTITGDIPDLGYVKIVASEDPADDEIDLNKWYPEGETAQSMSNKVKPMGLKITTTVDCSVYAGNRLPQSFDAANILPITALQMDYMTQDYPGYDHENKGGGHPVVTILATENNTEVTFIPSSNVLNNDGTTKKTIKKTLQAGEVLYLTGENRASLSGSIINSNKKIAVFSGINNTDVPGPLSARDHLYEQNMPVEYWGTHFVVTRSMKKDANRIRVTAKENNTQLFLDGSIIPSATISAGETYEFELCSKEMRREGGYTQADDIDRGTDFFLEGEAHYLETSCPCAVFSYDVSENYYRKANGPSERDESAAGDPSMVWISPIEQQLRNVTFGVMNTDKTPTHYVNIVTPTIAADSLKVRVIKVKDGKVEYGENRVQAGDVKVVPGNPDYSYARIKLVENADSVYTITSNVGFVAYVYGSGNKESYAYSAGSAAVEYGVTVSGEPFIDGWRSDTKFCIGTELEFDARVGTSEITRVDWDFGDGKSEHEGEPFTIHTYTTPGWYDITANLYGHQACADEDEQELGSVSFSFRVVRPDTVFGGVEPSCIELADYKANPDYWDEKIANPEIDTIQEHCYDDVVLKYVIYNRESEETKDTIKGEDVAYGYNGKAYYASQNVVDTSSLVGGCNHYIRYYVKVVTCLDIDIKQEPLQSCLGENVLVDYRKTKGDIDGKAVFTIAELPDFRKEISISPANISGTIDLPIRDLKEPGYYTAIISVNDVYCKDRENKFTIPITVHYPKDIFVQKFGNVLAVYAPGNGDNKGYTFTGYQWYRNGEAIPNATSAVYHSETPLEGSYYVELKNGQNVTLPSCEQTFQVQSNMPSQAPAAQKKIINQQIRIVIDNRTYDMYGQRVE